MIASSPLSSRVVPPVWLVAGLVLLPIGCFTAFVLAYAVNVPWFDDIDAFVSFLLGYLDAPTVGDKVQWLVRPNNEHRILLAKLIAVGMYNLTGELNFRGLIVVAYLFLLGSLALLYRVFRSTRLPLLAFVPVPFLLLQPQYHLTTLWAVTGLQHQLIVGLILLIIYLLAKDDRGSLWLAVGLQVLASLSMSNGLFGWVAGAGVLVVQGRYKPLVVWLLMSVATIWFYFHDVADSRGNEGVVAFFLRYPYINVAAFFTFIGGLFDFAAHDAPIVPRSVLPTLAGVGLAAGLVYFLWTMNWPFRPAFRPTDPRRLALLRRRHFFTGVYLFLLVNAVVVAFLRPPKGYGVLLVSNYMLYSALLVALLYLNGLSEWHTQWNTRLARRWLRLGGLTAAGVWLLSYAVHWPVVAQRRDSLLSFAYNQQQNGYGMGGTFGTPFGEWLRHKLDTIVSRDIYHYPTAFAPYQTALQPGQRPTRPDTALRFDVMNTSLGYVATATGSAFPPARVWIVAQSDRHVCLFPATSSFRPGSFWLRRDRMAVAGDVMRSMLPPGTYRLGLLTADGPETVRFSRQTVSGTTPASAPAGPKTEEARSAQPKKR
jgi:hypothetical protein